MSSKITKDKIFDNLLVTRKIQTPRYSSLPSPYGYQLGAIIFDFSTNKFWGRTATGWTELGGGGGGGGGGQPDTIERITFPNTIISPDITTSIVEVTPQSAEALWGVRGYYFRIAGSPPYYNAVNMGMVMDLNGNSYLASFGNRPVSSPPNYFNIVFYNANGSIAYSNFDPILYNQNVYILKYSNNGFYEWLLELQIDTSGFPPSIISYRHSLATNNSIVFSGDYTNVDIDVLRLLDNGSSLYLWIYQNFAPVLTSKSWLFKSSTNGIAQWGTFIGSNPDPFSILADYVSIGNTNIHINNDDYTVICASSSSTFPGWVPIWIPNPLSQAYSLLDSYLFSTYTYNQIIVRYNPSGYAQWGATLEGTSSPHSIKSNNDFIVLAGRFTGTLNVYNSRNTDNLYDFALPTLGLTLEGSGSTDCFLVKYTNSGIPVWATKIAGINSELDYGIDVSLNASGDMIVTGDYSSSPLYIYNAGGEVAFSLQNSGQYDCFIAKYNSDGVAQWATKIAGVGIDSGRAVSLDDSGRFVVGGSYNQDVSVYNSNGSVAYTLPNNGFTNCFVAKYNSNGIAYTATKIESVSLVENLEVALNGDQFMVSGTYASTTELVAYDSGGIVGVTLPSITVSGTNTQMFAIKYSAPSQGSTLSLPNGIVDGWEKYIYANDEITIVPEGTINNASSITLTTNEEISLLWDAENSNWIIL